MATVKDFVQDTDNDILFKDGDLAINFSDEEHITDVVISAPGDWKEFPLCGVSIDSYLNSSGAQLVLQQQIMSQLKTDGYSNATVVFEGTDVSKFNVDAVRD